MPTDPSINAGEVTAGYVGSGTTLDLLVPFFKGTTRIWVNGLIKRLGVDYTEAPAAGTIEFGSAVSSSDQIIATFVAATGTNGGVPRRVL